MALVKKYHVKVCAFKSPIEGVYEVEFEAEKRFKFKPGQFLHLALDEYNPSQAWPESRCFSMQSAPEDERIKITFSTVGAYTQRMARELTVGKKVWLKLPYGSLFLNKSAEQRSVFLAGGTGVTPFLSLFRSEIFKEYKKPFLYLGLRSLEYNLYSEDLQLAGEKNKEFDYHVVYQDKNGLIDIYRVFDTHGANSTYFISGPPQMINKFREELVRMGVSEINVITDDWE
jgi:predicted ferric reductase